MAAPTPAAAPAPAPAPAEAPTTISIHPPSKYASSAPSSSSPPPPPPPPPEWLHRTWTVTHSTLKMWRTAQNVRIRYTPLPPGRAGALRNEDRVEYESNKAGSKGGVSSVEGANTASSSGEQQQQGGSWDWRGKGLLFFVTSHWEILGWGERPLPPGDGKEEGEVERWAVTWFARTLFTDEGLDFYCDRPGGLSAETAAALRAALEGGAAGEEVARRVRDALWPVDIKLPWREK